MNKLNWQLSDTQQQNGRIAVITGANTGLGFETALTLASKEFHLVLACRDAQRAQTAKANILKQHPNSVIDLMSIDTAKLASVTAFAEQFLEQYDRCDLLINNAGIMMTPYQLTEDGFERQLATNYIGHFHLTNLLLPLITKTAGARVVSISSLSHQWTNIHFDDIHFKQGYSKKLAYAQSKLACLMFALELQRKLSASGFDTLSLAAHPGVSHSELTRNLTFPINKIARILSRFLTQSTKGGAQPILYAALGNDLSGGEYTGPSGMKEYIGPPTIVDYADSAKEPHNLTRLWQISKEMTGRCFFAQT